MQEVCATVMRLETTSITLQCIQFIRQSIIKNLLIYACLLAGNTTVFCPWPSYPSLLVYAISLSFISLSVSLCQVFRGLPLRFFPGGWLDSWWFLEISWVCVLSTSISLISFYFMKLITKRSNNTNY